jgi:thioredoxin 1
MATVALSNTDFAETVKSNDTVIVDFWADWCGPCKKFAPTYEKVSEEYGNVVFGKVDTEAEQELAMQFGIRSIPTLAIFREGIVLYSEPGALPEAGLKELVDKALALDMEEVKAQVAEENK